MEALRGYAEHAHPGHFGNSFARSLDMPPLQRLGGLQSEPKQTGRVPFQIV